jgi:hypothetical protein
MGLEFYEASSATLEGSLINAFNYSLCQVTVLRMTQGMGSSHSTVDHMQ